MCLSQPSSLYQRCFLFPLLKGPGFPAVFLENFPIFEGFLRAKCFPTVKGRAQGCKKKKLKSRRQTHTPGKNTCHRTLQICIKHAMCFSQWYVPVLIFYFILFYFFSPEVPERNPWNFFPQRSRRGTLETLLLVFFSSSSFVVRRVSMGILETDTWPEQDHKRESTLAQTFDLWLLKTYEVLCCLSLSRFVGRCLFF